jgi:hypothetical protein
MPPMKMIISMTMALVGRSFYFLVHCNSRVISSWDLSPLPSLSSLPHHQKNLHSCRPFLSGFVKEADEGRGVHRSLLDESVSSPRQEGNLRKRRLIEDRRSADKSTIVQQGSKES